MNWTYHGLIKKKKAQPKKKNFIYRIYCFVYMGFKMFWILKGCEIFQFIFIYKEKKKKRFQDNTYIHVNLGQARDMNINLTLNKLKKKKKSQVLCKNIIQLQQNIIFICKNKYMEINSRETHLKNISHPSLLTGCYILRKHNGVMGFI